MFTQCGAAAGSTGQAAATTGAGEYPTSRMSASGGFLVVARGVDDVDGLFEAFGAGREDARVQHNETACARRVR